MADQITIENITQVLPSEDDDADTLSFWMRAYFALEVATAESSRKVQNRDLNLFLAFFRRETGCEARNIWTARLSRDFVDSLRHEVKENRGRRYSDRTISRIVAHLRTFAKWIHKFRNIWELKMLN